MPALNVIIPLIVIMLAVLISGNFILPFLKQNVVQPQISNSSRDNCNYPGQEPHRRGQRLREAMQKVGNLRHGHDKPMSPYACEQTSDENCREQAVHEASKHIEYIGKGYCTAGDERLQIIKFTQVHLRVVWGNDSYIGSGSIVDPRHILDPMGRYDTSVNYPTPNHLWILTAAHCVFNRKKRSKCDYGEVRVPEPHFWSPFTSSDYKKYGEVWGVNHVQPGVLDDGRFLEPLKFSDADIFVYGAYEQETITGEDKSHGTDLALLRVPLPDKVRYYSYTLHERVGLEQGSLEFDSRYYGRQNYFRQDDAFYGAYDDSDAYKNKKKQNGFKTDVFVFGYPGDIDKEAICHLSCPSKLQSSEDISYELKRYSMASAPKDSVKIPYGPSTKFWPVTFNNGHGKIRYTNQTSGGMSGGGVFLIDQDEDIHPKEKTKSRLFSQEPEFLGAARLKAVHRGECEVGPIHAPVKYNQASLITPKVLRWMNGVIKKYD